MAKRERASYQVPLDALEASVHVDPDELITEADLDPRAPEDSSAGHLPGNVRPFAL